MQNWEKAERKIAQKLNGKRVPGSGCGNRKGDIRSSSILMEVKETSRPYMSFVVDWLVKIKREAAQSKRIPAFGIEFGDGTTIYVVPEHVVEFRDHRRIVDWRRKSSVRLYPGDLECSDVIITDFGSWVVVDEDCVKSLGE